MPICKYCNQEIEWRESKKTGKPYSINTDGSLHQCSNYDKFNNDKRNCNPEVSSEQSKASYWLTNEGELLDNRNIENAKWFIDGLNLRLVCKRIELVVKEMDGSSQ